MHQKTENHPTFAVDVSFFTSVLHLHGCDGVLVDPSPNQVVHARIAATTLNYRGCSSLGSSGGSAVEPLPRPEFRPGQGVQSLYPKPALGFCGGPTPPSSSARGVALAEGKSPHNHDPARHGFGRPLLPFKRGKCLPTCLAYALSFFSPRRNDLYWPKVVISFSLNWPAARSCALHISPLRLTLRLPPRPPCRDVTTNAYSSIEKNHVHKNRESEMSTDSMTMPWHHPDKCLALTPEESNFEVIAFR